MATGHGAPRTYDSSGMSPEILASCHKKSVRKLKTKRTWMEPCPEQRERIVREAAVSQDVMAGQLRIQLDFLVDSEMAGSAKMSTSPCGNVWCDNQSAIAQTLAGSSSNLKTRHVSIKAHRLGEDMLGGVSELAHIQSEDQRADCLTKAYTKPLMLRCYEHLSLVSIYGQDDAKYQIISYCPLDTDQTYLTRSTASHPSTPMGSSSQSTGLDQLVNLLTDLGLDTADMSLVEAQQLISRAATTGQITQPASSSQVLPNTIESRPTEYTARPQDQDDVPLIGLLSRPSNDEEESTSMAAILREAAPLPAPQPVPMTTFMGVEVPQPQPPTAHATAKAPPSVFVPYPEGAWQTIAEVANTRQRRRRAAESIVPPTAPTAMREEPMTLVQCLEDEGPGCPLT
eukprot:3266049-Amphidinium_carterae.4